MIPNQTKYLDLNFRHVFLNNLNINHPQTLTLPPLTAPLNNKSLIQTFSIKVPNQEIIIIQTIYKLRSSFTHLGYI